MASTTTLTFQGLPMAGTTAQRPANPAIGQPYYDTSTGQFLVSDGTNWHPFVPSYVTAVTPANSAQNNGAALSYGYNVVTGADGTKAVVLPEAVAGAVVEIKNVTAAVLKCFPAVNDAVNALSANSVFNIPASTACKLVAVDAVTWYSTPLLPS